MAMQPRPIPLRRYVMWLSAWAVLSVAWTGYAAFDLYRRAEVQAEMARDVERDLDQGLSPISCSGSHCDKPVDNAQDRWADIASTYLRFGKVEMEEFVILPPIALLIAGLGILFTTKRLRRSA